MRSALRTIRRRGSRSSRGWAASGACATSACRRRTWTRWPSLQPRGLLLLLRRRQLGPVTPPRLPTLPYLAPWYRLAEVEGGLALEYGQTVVRLDGAAVRLLLPALLPLLDGTRTVDEVVEGLGEP